MTGVNINNPNVSVPLEKRDRNEFIVGDLLTRANELRELEGKSKLDMDELSELRDNWTSTDGSSVDLSQDNLTVRNLSTLLKSTGISRFNNVNVFNNEADVNVIRNEYSNSLKTYKDLSPHGYPHSTLDPEIRARFPGIEQTGVPVFVSKDKSARLYQEGDNLTIGNGLEDKTYNFTAQSLDSSLVNDISIQDNVSELSNKDILKAKIHSLHAYESAGNVTDDNYNSIYEDAVSTLADYDIDVTPEALREGVDMYDATIVTDDMIDEYVGHYAAADSVAQEGEPPLDKAFLARQIAPAMLRVNRYEAEFDAFASTYANTELGLDNTHNKVPNHLPLFAPFDYEHSSIMDEVVSLYNDENLKDDSYTTAIDSLSEHGITVSQLDLEKSVELYRGLENAYNSEGMVKYVQNEMSKVSYEHDIDIDEWNEKWDNYIDNLDTTPRRKEAIADGISSVVKDSQRIDIHEHIEGLVDTRFENIDIQEGYNIYKERYKEGSSIDYMADEMFAEVDYLVDSHEGKALTDHLDNLVVESDKRFEKDTGKVSDSSDTGSGDDSGKDETDVVMDDELLDDLESLLEPKRSTADKSDKSQPEREQSNDSSERDNELEL